MEIKFRDKELKAEAAKHGLALGIIVWVLSLVFSYVMLSSSSFWVVVLVMPVLISFLIPVVSSIFLSIDLRKKIGGYWDLRKATSGIFIMFLVAFILHTGLQTFFVKVVEPNWSEKVVTSVADATHDMMLKQGVDKNEINKKVDDLKKGFEQKNSNSIGKTIQGYFINLIFLFVFAFFLALIFKRNNPNPFAGQANDQFENN
ncbi:DUF4199 domain-containing protein [Pedobacter xixiisoli]|uniref:DUF4199 domain-containing protein n=1 Tax=Pedobacter xixiisoli TaxID=1476464 RepID=A0A285ZWV8_9SPHI|nr:DUF4199 domain-containing protein [Pedobacter xixiisoli]SOD14116.1 Protein of unknown function [Pedobacter xixiisoli]